MPSDSIHDMVPGGSCDMFTVCFDVLIMYFYLVLYLLVISILARWSHVCCFPCEPIGFDSVNILTVSWALIISYNSYFYLYENI